MDDHIVTRETHDAGQVGAASGGHLAGHPDMRAALIVDVDNGGVRLQVDLVDAGGAELPLHDDLGVTERGIDIAPFVNHAAVVVAEFLKLFDATVVVVVGVDEDGVGLGCFFRVKQRGQFFVGDVDEG